MTLLLAAAPAVAPAARSGASLRSLFAVPRPAVPEHDVVVDRPTVADAGISAAADTQRYSIGDGSEDTIAVSVTSACRASCTDADPQQIADFIGTLIHGYEVDMLTVQLDTPFQIGLDCGFDAQSCYYSGENKIVLSGNDTATPDGASREFVLAHEYGHHVAQHRGLPSPFPAAIDWGPERWSSYEHVCQGYRAGALFPGDEGAHYFQDPGEAWAEAFARYRFPEAAVKWRWAPSLRPDAGAFRAIREDTLHPWKERSLLRISGRVRPGARAVARSFATPLDGRLSIGPAGRWPDDELILSNGSGRVLRSSGRRRLRHRFDYTVCGQSRLRVTVKPAGPGSRSFGLTVLRP